MEVRVEDLLFWRGRRLVLDVPALTIAPGRVTALVGPNGSGKSTFLRLVAGLERPGEGGIYLGGELARHRRPGHRSISYAFQRPVFLGGTVRANLDLALRLRGLSSTQRAVRIDEVASACEITRIIDSDAGRLSGGEAQRANLARALCLRAPLTLLDEPLTGLDSPVRLQLLHELPALLARFATTTIVVTHDRDEAARLADDMVVLMEGRVSAAGDKLAVLRSPPDPATASFLGYTVFDTDAGRVAVAPGALTAGPGDVSFDLAVEAVVDFAGRSEVVGFVAGRRVTVAVHGRIPAVGERIAVSAPHAAVVRWYPE
jgi:ABC-type sugar transport system ATPase subunit